MKRMDVSSFMAKEGELPLENIVSDGGYCSIFRTIACVGDSLSSGEFESTNPDGTTAFNDLYDYSWGQFLARMAGLKAINMSRGGMTAKEYIESFADANGYFSADLAAQGYIIAMGVNDLYYAKPLIEIGSTDDVCVEDYTKNKPTFVGYYAQIIQRYKKIQPDAKFFLVTIPYSNSGEQMETLADRHSEILYKLAEMFDNCYVLDIRKYGPVYADEFHKTFFLGGHMNPMGYVFTAKIIASYIDWIIRHNPADFKQVGFIGTDLKNTVSK